MKQFCKFRVEGVNFHYIARITFHYNEFVSHCEKLCVINLVLQLYIVSFAKSDSMSHFPGCFDRWWNNSIQLYEVKGVLVIKYDINELVGNVSERANFLQTMWCSRAKFLFRKLISKTNLVNWTNSAACVTLPSQSKGSRAIIAFLLSIFA